MPNPLHYTRYGESPPQRSGASHAAIAPYGPFAAGDGTEVVIAVQNDREWVAFCRVVLGDPSVAADARFASNADRVKWRADLHQLINRALAGLSGPGLLERLGTAGIG